jgi:acetyl-CoA decarbonylase/synthase complex subunit gamma
MPLTGLEIYKLLPKTNCKDCGFPTCLAFAMQLAAKKVELQKCPHVSEEATTALEGAAAPPIRMVRIGTGEAEVKVGEETQLFRHDDKFYNPAGVGITVDDDLEESAFSERVEKINNLQFTRVGQEISVDLIAVVNKSGDANTFAQRAKLAAEKSPLALILVSKEPESIRAALEEVSGKRPLICAADAQNYEDLARLAQDKSTPLAVAAETLEEAADLSEKIKALGIEDLMLDVGGKAIKEALLNFTKMRRAAIKRNFRPLGFPIIVFAQDSDPYKNISLASTYMAKYAGIIVTDCIEPWQILPLLTVRQNIYTDPQKPIQVEEKLYAVGEPDENAPLLFTTNFSLTYYTVEGDVEASRVPAWILAVDTEGTSVLTAYAGDKLTEKTVAQALQKTEAAEKVKHKKLIIPGLVAVMSGKLEEETGWDILVGPRESAQLSKYLNTVWRESAAVKA